MRILLVSHTLPHDEPGGSQDYVAALATALSVEHEVLVVSGSSAGDTGLDVHAIPRLPVLPPSASFARKTLWHIKDQWSIKEHRALRRELDAFRPDVVHTHQCQGLTGGVFSAIDASGLPHVHTAHDLNLLCVRVTMTRGGQPCGGRCGACLLQRAIKGSLAARRLDYLISPSDFICREHVEAGVVAQSRAVTVRHGAAPGTSRLRGSQSGSISVGFIGRIATHKGIATLLSAVEVSSRPWQLHVAGDGPLAAAVIDAAAHNPRVSYHGFLRDGARSSFYDSLDLLVVPSEYAEAATMVVTEAAVRALPSVVSDAGGLPETPLATVFVSGDSRGLADALDALDEDRALLRETSAKLAARQDEFLWERHVASVVEILERAQREPRALPPRVLGRRGVLVRAAVNS